MLNNTYLDYSQVPSLEKSHSPSPAPPTFPDAHLSQQEQQQQQHSDRQHSDRRHNMVHYGRDHDDMRETSPAGAGLFSPPGECSGDEGLSSVGVVAGSFPRVTLGSSGGGGGKGVESHGGEVELHPLGCELKSSEHTSNHIINGIASVGGVNFSVGGLDEGEEESCLDFRSIRRSSKLVDLNDLQALRVRAESCEHNFPPPEHEHSIPMATQPPPNPKQQLQESLTESLSPYTGSIHFTASGFSRMSPSSENGIRSSTPTGNYMEDSGGGGGQQVPQVFVERPFSPPDVAWPTDSAAPIAGDFPSISDWSSRGGIDHSHSTNSRSLAEGEEEELSSMGIGPSPCLLEGSGADESDSSVSPPLPPKIKEGKVKEVELAEMSDVRLSENLTGREGRALVEGQALVSELEPSLLSGKMNTYTNNPFSASTVNPCSTVAVNPYSTAADNPYSTTTTVNSYSTATVNPYSTTAVNPYSTTTSSADALPMNNMPPSTSPVLPPRVGSHPRAAAHSSPFSTFLHSPQPYKSSLATPHVLGGRGDDDDDAEPLEQVRVRANSNRTERWVSHDPRSKVGVSQSPSSPLSHSTEGSTDFLENFIDGF